MGTARKTEVTIEQITNGLPIKVTMDSVRAVETTATTRAWRMVCVCFYPSVCYCCKHTQVRVCANALLSIPAMKTDSFTSKSYPTMRTLKMVTLREVVDQPIIGAKIRAVAMQRNAKARGPLPREKGKTDMRSTDMRCRSGAVGNGKWRPISSCVNSTHETDTLSQEAE